MIYSKGDTIVTKKPHACGGEQWTVIRTGADIKLKCNKCSRIVMVSFDNFPKIVKKHIIGTQ